jgi:hypothetical protein
MQIKNSSEDEICFKSDLFQETLEFKNTIACCYGQQQSMALQGCVLNRQV